MKKSSLQVLKALLLRKTYHRIHALSMALVAVLVCGMSSGASAQVSINLSTPLTIPAANACPGAVDVPLYAFRLTGTGTGQANGVGSIGFTRTGTATVGTDIIQYKLWKVAIGAGGTLMATSTTPFFNTFSGETFSAGTTIVNYWITADIATTATAGNTIAVNTMTTADIFTSGPLTGGGTVAGGLQTLRALPTIGGITASPTGPFCANVTVLTLTAVGSPAGTGTPTYIWTGPNSYSASTAGNSTSFTPASAAASGVYSLSVSYPGTGCVSVPHGSATVTVNNAPSLPATGFICNNNTAPYAQFTGVYLNSGATGGVWTTSNAAVAAIVDPTTGLIMPSYPATGGTAVITQTTSCGVATETVTVAARPSHITGPIGNSNIQQVCTRSSILLTSAFSGGVWSTSLPAALTLTPGPSTQVNVLGKQSYEPLDGVAYVVLTNATNGCDTAIAVNVHSTPYDITGPSAVCVQSTITLADATLFGTWSSSNTTMATVTQGPGAGGGLVTGVAQGSPVITYGVQPNGWIGAGGCYNTKTITVNPLPAAITGYDTVCTGGGTTTLSDVTPGGVWSSSQPSVAVVSGASPGQITVTGSPNQAGFTNIVYTLSATGCQATRLVRVNKQPDPITGPTQVCAGNTITLMDAVPGGVWSTPNTTIDTIDHTTGVLYGQYGPQSPQTDYNITYNLTSCIAVTYTVTVNNAPLPINGVQNVCIGFTTSLSDVTAGGVWTSSGPSTIATLAPPAIVSGVSQGAIMVTYTLPATGCYDTAFVIVYPNPASITGPDHVCQNATVTLSDATTGGTWSSTALAIAAVVGSSGVVSGISAGGVNISYTMPTGCYATIPFTVDPPVIAAVSIDKNPAGPTCAGTHNTYTAIEVNGGIPTYQWFLFSQPIAGATNASYTNAANASNNGDLITVEMYPHFSCATRDTAYDSLVAVVYPVNQGPIVSLVSAPTSLTATFLGQVYTFYAGVTWGGQSPVYQWYVNGTAIPGANASTYSTPVYTNDTFYCKVTGTTPCDNSHTVGISDSVVILASYLKVDPLSVVTNNLVVFPNPSNGTIVLSGAWSSAQEAITIEVSDMLGHVVYKGQTMPANGNVHAQLDLDNMPPGTYLMHVSASAANQVFRFVIAK